MKSVLISIQPKWCELIASGKKTVEVRKTKPKIETPFKCYIYCTQGKLADLGVIGQTMYEKRMRVIGEFVCDRIDDFVCYDYITPTMVSVGKMSCLTPTELIEYVGSATGYGWHISDLVIYDDPKELSEFHKVGYQEAKDYVYGWSAEEEKSWQISRPPQSWRCVEEVPV